MLIYELERGDLFKIDDVLMQYHGMDGMYAKVTFGAREWNPTEIHSANFSGNTDVEKVE